MTPRMETAKVSAWESLFGELTEEERTLLTTLGPLGSYEDEHRFILRMFMQPAECPACQQPVPPRQALGHPIDYNAIEDDFTCPHCHRELHRIVPVTRPDFWRLAQPLGPATAKEQESGT